MAPELCPICGQAHGAGSTFDCPGHSEPKTDANASPVFVSTPDTQFMTGQAPTSGLSDFSTELGTKLSAGTLVGEYQILRRIGEGGMGTVYGAVHPIIGKKVAIKVLAGRLAKNKNAIRRFVLEARAVNDIRHPGLVDIFSFGQLTDGRHYYVMEFLDGRDLGDVLRERISLPLAEAIPIFIEVGHALVAVHSKGIVHRDLKPENILILSTAQAGGQRVKLVDFGLAKLVEGVPTHLSEGGPSTAAGVNVGTPHYMSPEQCRGQKVDARADLYALGVLLYETLTGKLPFDGATAVDIWQAHAEKAPRPPNEIAPGLVTPALNAIVLRLLAKQPENRFQSAADLCAALENLTEDGHPKRTPAPLRLGESASDPWQSTRGRAGHQAPGEPLYLEGGGHLPLGRRPAAYPPHPADHHPSDHDEVVATAEEPPRAYVPEAILTEEDRRKEIEELRASLGLHIEEPASTDRSDTQMSALVIDLGHTGMRSADPRSQVQSERHSLPLPRPRSGPHYTSRLIEERTYVPPLAAPSSRVGGGPPHLVEETAYPSSHKWKILRVVIVLALLAAATVVAITFIK
jgi:serine/threonine protein kinase